jgi:putative CocE/NonD family hydrolase
MTSKQMYVRASLLIVLLAVFRTPLLAAEPFAIKVEFGVSVKMRDGVTLRADIYRPDADGKFPVLLQRTPYNKLGWGMNFAHRAAARGYVVIIQDVSGRYTSEGDWYTFIHEAEDGYDTIEWAAALPYSDGRVGMFGGSYVGATQVLAATVHPPHLAGICPVVTASNYHDGWTYQGGAFEQWFNESWASGLATNTMRRRAEKNYDPLGGSKVLPLISYPVLEPPSGEGIAPYFKDWLAHPNFDEYWKQISI